MMITRDLILSLTPRPSNKAKREIWDAYAQAMTSPQTAGRLGLAGINSELRLAHLLAQWLHESGGFTVLWEDMSYSATRIGQIFGPGRHSAKVGPDEAKRLAHDPAALAERVYGLGNPKKAAELGNREEGDGYRYRGFGIGQITGRADHERLLGGKTTVQASIDAAIAEWTEKGCNRLADADDVVGITRKINGGTNGLDDREAWLEKTKAAVSGMTFGSGAPSRVPVVEATPSVSKEETVARETDFVSEKIPAQTAGREIAIQSTGSLPSSPKTFGILHWLGIAAGSKTILAIINTKILIVLGFLTNIGEWIVDWFGVLFGVLPAAIEETIELAGKSSRLSELIGFDWKRVAFVVGIGALSVALVRHAQKKSEAEELKRELETLRGQQS